MDEKILKFLYDIQQSIAKIERYVEEQTIESYLQDEKTQDAVARNFEIIGEAINNIRKIAPDVASQIREARKIIGFRNILIHGYDAISDYITWDIIQTKLPLLKEDVEKIAKM